MLWKKESNDENALYVDFVAMFGGKYVSSICEQSVIKKHTKSDARSQQNRKEGNKYFNRNRNHWTLAMAYYNESLRYAENGSETVSLAYANRSSCFLKMKWYEECLIDIELAKEAGYPVELMPKLNQRKQKCLKYMEERTEPVKRESALSFEANELLPCMANVLKIDKDAEGELAVFAKEDIGPGQTIAIEKAFLNYVYDRTWLGCNICLKQTANLVPCKNCTTLCCIECQSESIHEHECGIEFSKNHNENGNMMKELRIILMVINMFSNADEIMEFVEETIRNDSAEMPPTFNDAKSKYRAFLKLPVGPKFLSNEQFTFIVSEIYKLCSKVQKSNQRSKQ